MSLNRKISVVDKAVLITTGNTNVICGSSTESNYNTSDMVTLTGNTTRNYAESGSMAVLDMLSNSTVLYAELIWYSTVASTVEGAVDVRSVEDNAVSFAMPNGDIMYVEPDYTENFITVESSSVVRFRSADVTNIVKSYNSGQYSVSNIPTSIPPSGLSDVRCGWSLNVIYRNDSIKPKKVDFLSGIAYATSTQPYQTMITGFTTPSSLENLTGDILITAANGDAVTSGDTVSIGPSLANLTVLGNSVESPNPNPLTAPNNPYNNFFSGQVNICNSLSSNKGLINISGTNGNNNSDAFIPSQIIGARNKWDMTDIDISNTLNKGQTQLAFQLTSNNHSIELLSIGTQVDAVAPDITVDFEIYDSDGDLEYNIEVGAKILYSIAVRNDGIIAADNMRLSLNPGDYASIVPGTLKVNNVLFEGDIVSGINIGTIDPYGSSTIAFEVEVNSLPPFNETLGFHAITNAANYSYEFISGINTITNTGVTTSKTLIVEEGKLSIIKSVSPSTVQIGDTVVYTNVITNTGTQTLRNIFFQDIDGNHTSFVPGSVVINDVARSELDPNTGFSLEDLSEGNTIDVKYSVIINSIFPYGSIDTKSTIKYSYELNQYTNPIFVTENSNSVSIAVNYSEVIKQTCASNDNPVVSDIVTYTTTLTNVGNISATNVLVQDTPVIGASFIDGSVTVNGIPEEGVNPYTGFILSDAINPLESVEVKYNVRIDSIEPKGIIDNTAEIPFEYKITDTQGIITDTETSNTVESLSNYVCLSMTEYVDKTCATVGESIIYTVDIANTGNTNAVNTFFTSNIYEEAAFVGGSVLINGISYTSYNPFTGFSLGTICAGNSVRVIFKVTVNDVPPANILYNQSNLAYSYLINPNGTLIDSRAVSNRVETTINEASYTITMNVDKNYVIVGETVNFTATINNTGSVDLYDIAFYDNLSEFLQFTVGSVYINGVNYPLYNPVSGFNIETLHAGDTATILFAAKVVDTPPSNIIIGKGIFNFSYRTCSNNPVVTTTEYTNEVQINIVNGNLTAVKTVDQAYGQINDIITYSVNVSNTGNVPLTNVNFTDILEPSLSFISGSVTINNVSRPAYDPNVGFTLGNINVGQTILVTFRATVVSVPAPNVISNFAAIRYSFTIDPSKEPETQSKNSNTVTTVINRSDVILAKRVDKIYAAVNDIITYTLNIQNTGTVAISNIFVRDILQAEAEFVIDSVVINGVSRPGYNPNTGFYIDNILENGTATISFQAKVIAQPESNAILNTANISYQYKLTPTGETFTDSRTSNTTITNINSSVVTNTKSVDKAYASIDDTLTYTSVIRNSGTVTIRNTIFTDIIPSGTTFVAGSVTINDVAYSDYNPQTGFTLGDIVPNESVNVKFNVSILSDYQVELITNQSNLNYSYQPYPEEPDVLYGNALSNIVTTIIRVGRVNITKSADRLSARVDDIVTYRFDITNTGNTALSNLFFRDVIQSQSSFITNSLYIDNVQVTGVDPTTGFNLENMDIGTVRRIEFKVQVNSIPAEDGILYNTGTLTYSYYVNPNEEPLTASQNSNTTEVQVVDTIISADKAVDKTSAKINDSLNFTITIRNEGNVPAENITFIDALSSSLRFVEGSVYINDVQYSSYNPVTGFPLPNINGATNLTVRFAADIISRPQNNQIINAAEVTYSYTVGGVTYNYTTTTNTTTTVVAYGEMTITKVVDKQYANIGDDIIYTIGVENTGSVAVTDLLFRDIIQSDAVFNAGTVVIDNVNYPSYDPNDGFALTDLQPNNYHIVSFSVRVLNLPSTGQIDNTANVTFTYRLTAADEPVTTNVNSNTVVTYINLGRLAVSKSVDKAYATLNDTVTYTINVTNTGNVVCENVFFRDIVQSNASFIPQSVRINDVIQDSYNPNTGFNLPDISSGESVKVEFSVQINTMPSDQILYNTANVSYEYTPNPTSGAITVTSSSNTVMTTVNEGKLSVTKLVDKSYATIGDVITYTINITNTGTVNALAVNFRDVIQSGLNFVNGSVTIGGVSYPSYNPYDSFSLGQLTPGQSVQVTFKATVVSVPTPNVINNTANVVFSYYIDPNGNVTTSETNSNTVQTTINAASLSVTKSVDKSYAVANEVLTYSFVVANTGNIDLTNVNFVDNLQSDVTFNIGSVVVNNVSQPSYNPVEGFNLGTIAALETINVSFTVTVISAPVNNVVNNFAVVSYSYKINPNGETYTSTMQSNTVITNIVRPEITGTKAVDLNYATIGDTLNYSITVKNSGNYLLTSVNFIDTLSNGGTFVNGSVLIDGVSYESYNPLTGFALPDLIPGNTTKVEFKVLVESLPSPAVITNSAILSAKCVITETGTTIDVSNSTNQVTTNIIIGSLTSSKTVDKMYVRVGDTVTYVNTITNNGNTVAASIFFRDILQEQLSFVTGSVRIGEVLYPSLNPNTGFALSDLAAGASVTVSFDAVINALPVPPIINNNSTTTFKYKINPAGIDYNGTTTTNTVVTNVVKGELSASKVVDKTIATIGDELTYTIIITNTGNVAANNVVFTDIPSSGVTFKSGSVIVNNVSQPGYDPTTGFTIPSIAIGGVAVVSFKVEVTSVPTSNNVTNAATISFSYLVDPKDEPYTATITSNTVTTNIVLSKIEVTKAVDKNYVTIGDKLTYTITIRNVGNINASNVQFIDPTPENTIFVIGSVTVNGVSYPNYNPETGFMLGTMVPGQTVSVVYQVQVTNSCSAN